APFQSPAYRPHSVPDTIPSLFVLTTPPQPRSTLLPYTTLFRSIRFGTPYSVTACANRRAMLSIWLALILSPGRPWCSTLIVDPLDRKSTRLNSSHVSISYAVFCLKKKMRQRSAIVYLDERGENT